MKTVALVGCGNLGSIVARGIAEKIGEHYRLIAVTDSRQEAAANLAKSCGCKACADLQEMLGHRPDYVVEATTPAVLKQIAEAVLFSGADLLPLSTGAFADDEFYHRVRDVARQAGRHIYVVAGAIGGLDIMQAALLAGPLSAQIENIKNPRALAGAPGFKGDTLPEDREVIVFSGSARDAIQAFPQNVNVAVSVATATVGVDETRVQVRSAPSAVYNTHRISLSGAFGEASIVISSRPSPDNPKSSMIAALSVLAKLKNLAEPVSFC